MRSGVPGLLVELPEAQVWAVYSAAVERGFAADGGQGIVGALSVVPRRIHDVALGLTYRTAWLAVAPLSLAVVVQAAVEPAALRLAFVVPGDLGSLGNPGIWLTTPPLGLRRGY